MKSQTEGEKLFTQLLQQFRKDVAAMWLDQLVAIIGVIVNTPLDEREPVLAKLLRGENN